MARNNYKVLTFQSLVKLSLNLHPWKLSALTKMLAKLITKTFEDLSMFKCVNLPRYGKKIDIFINCKLFLVVSIFFFMKSIIMGEIKTYQRNIHSFVESRESILRSFYMRKVQNSLITSRILTSMLKKFK